MGLHFTKTGCIKFQGSTSRLSVYLHESSSSGRSKTNGIVSLKLMADYIIAR